MCECCEEIEFWKDRDNYKNEFFKRKVFSKLAIYTWKANEIATKGKQIGDITTRAFDLNYYPKCGRKVGK